MKHRLVRSALAAAAAAAAGALLGWLVRAVSPPATAPDSGSSHHPGAAGGRDPASR